MPRRCPDAVTPAQAGMHAISIPPHVGSTAESRIMEEKARGARCAGEGFIETFHSWVIAKELLLQDTWLSLVQPRWEGERCRETSGSGSSR